MRYPKGKNRTTGYEKMSNESLLLASLTSIQDIIKRMASNSLFIKGWSMSLTGVIIAIAKKDYTPESIQKIGMLLLIFNALFFMMDVYYLRLERKFRNEYNRKIETLATESDIEALTIIDRNKDCTSFFCVATSLSILPFYVVMAIIGYCVMKGGVI